jgi:hypothetical protein
VASIRGRVYLVQARSFLPGPAADEIAVRFGLRRPELAQVTQRLLRIGAELLAESRPEKFGDTGHAVRFWQAIWAALRQAERYVPLEGLDSYPITPTLAGEILRIVSDGELRRDNDIDYFLARIPGAGYPDQSALAVEAVNIVTDGVPVTWALHVCHGNRYARPSGEGHYDSCSRRCCRRGSISWCLSSPARASMTCT